MYHCSHVVWCAYFWYESFSWWWRMLHKGSLTSSLILLDIREFKIILCENNLLSFLHLAMTFRFGVSMRIHAHQTQAGWKGQWEVTSLLQWCVMYENCAIFVVQSVLSQQFQTKHHKPNKHFGVHRIKAAPFSCVVPEVEKRINLSGCYTGCYEQFIHLLIF